MADEAIKGGLELLRKPFEPNQISKLPKQQSWMTQKKEEYKNCNVCGGYHHPKAVHLDYVGHAALTDRLLDCDPNWNWEPVAFDANGAPMLDQNGGMWIKLTVCGVSRYGYGHPDGKKGGDAIKEVIGDALRNAAMRFGAALDLWHKGVLHMDDDDLPEPTKQPAKQPPKQADKPDFSALGKAITAAQNMDELKKAFVAAVSKARASGDKSAVDAFTKLKDDRKAELEAVNA